MLLWTGIRLSDLCIPYCHSEVISTIMALYEVTHQFLVPIMPRCVEYTTLYLVSFEMLWPIVKPGETCKFWTDRFCAMSFRVKKNNLFINHSPPGPIAATEFCIL